MDYILNAFDLTSLLMAFIGGCLTGIPTGPARFFVVDTVLNDGKYAALRLYSGFFLVSMLYAVPALLLDDLISDNKRIEAVSYLVASLLLIFWGLLFVAKSNKANRSSIDIHVGSQFTKGFIAGGSSLMTPFIYLAYIQLLKSYSSDVSLLQKTIFIVIFEMFSFLTTSVVAIILMRKRKGILDSWKTIKILMGVLLIIFGALNVYLQLDFSNGIKLKLQENFIEEHLPKGR